MSQDRIDCQVHPSETPFFSICIPQYNRTDFLIKAIESIACQSFRSVEICISDDCSPAGRHEEILNCLRNTRLPFRYRQNTKNLRYDGNLRSSISLASGKYCFLLANDDCLKSSEILLQLHQSLIESPQAEVVVTDYENYSDGMRQRRVVSTRLEKGSPETALRTYRSFSFVSGILFLNQSVKPNESHEWDGSEMFQMCLASRIIAKGGRVLFLDLVTVRKDIIIEGLMVDSAIGIAKREKHRPDAALKLPIRRLPEALMNAIRPTVSGKRNESQLALLMLKQLIVYTFSYWIVTFRHELSWRYAAYFWIGVRPSLVLSHTYTTLWDRAQLWVVYVFFGVLSLVTPVSLARAAFPMLHKLRTQRMLAWSR